MRINAFGGVYQGSHSCKPHVKATQDIQFKRCWHEAYFFVQMLQRSAEGNAVTEALRLQNRYLLSMMPGKLYKQRSK